jgi:hypothetical protein
MELMLAWLHGPPTAWPINGTAFLDIVMAWR